MNNPRRIVGVHRLEACASSGDSVLILRVHYSDCRWDSDVLTVYHDSEIGMYVKRKGFAPEAGEGKGVASQLALIVGDAANYYGYKDSQ